MRFLRKFFPQKEVHTIDGREVILLNRTKFNFNPFLRRVILLVCKTEAVAKHFSSLTFVLERFKEPGTFAEVRTKEILRGKMIIFLNSTHVDFSSASVSFPKEWRGTLIHELTHLLHFKVSPIVKQGYSSLLRLQQKLNKELARKLTRVQTYIGKDYALLRQILFLFMREVFIEGVARCYEEIQNEELLFTEDIFQERYESSEKAMVKLVGRLQEYNGGIKQGYSNGRLVLKIQAVLSDQNYSTGKHLVYTIMFINHKLLEEILVLRPFEFIREYEQCMESRGLQPVISVTSGKGIFDYRTVLSEWSAVAKEVWKKR